MDREKVINALHCRAYDDDFPCWKCAYYKQDEKPVARCDYRGLMDDAVALLKEQEAVEPGIAQDVDGIFATCGNCKKKLWKMMGLEFVVNPDEMPRFCPHCGQAVKWE